MTRRPGLSLTEVLVALFILALGVIAIQTMFPLAASQLLIAVKEDRSALAAINADAVLRSYWKTAVAEQPTTAGVTEPFFRTLDAPGPTDPLTHPVTRTVLTSAAAEPISYPVIVDPMGCAARSVAASADPMTNPGAWFGDNGATNIRRTTLGPNTSPAFALRTCSLVDGMGYDEFGVPSPDREFRYNWFWILQRTGNADQSNKKTARMTVVVFDKRAHMFAPPGSEAVYPNTLNPTPVTFTPGSTQLTLQGSPDLRPGSWVMDATVQPVPPPAGAPAGTLPTWIRHANMYRVSGIEQQGGNTLIDLETPIRRTDGLTTPYTGTLVVVRGVSGVYHRAALAGQE